MKLWPWRWGLRFSGHKASAQERTAGPGEDGEQPAPSPLDATRAGPGRLLPPGAGTDGQAGRSVVRASRGALGAGGDMMGNAIGPGSSTTFIEQVVVGGGSGAEVPCRRQLAPPPLGETAHRAEISASVKAVLLGREHEGRAPVLFLEGYGGIGKTTVALQTCRLPDVAERFPGGVVWTVVGQSRTGPDLADHIADICEHLSGRRPTTTDPLLVGALLGEILDETGPALVVVDDVWTEEQVSAFLVGGAGSARIFTARNRGLAPAVAEIVEVGEMTEDEARATASAGLPAVDASVLESLLRFAKGWPVLLGLINASLRAYIQAGGPPAEVAAWVAQLVASDGPEALDATMPPHMRSTVAATVNASLDLLSAEERERYVDLAVFDEDAEVPEHVVALLWSVTGGLERTGSRRMAALLSSLRLVSERWSDGGPAIAVHDVLRSYVRHQMSPADLVARNRSLVTALRTLLPAGAADEWWLLPQGEKFGLQYLPYHLQAAGLHAELAELACDPRWIETQIRHLGSVVPVVSTLSGIRTARAGTLRTVLGRDIEVFVPEAAPSAVGATLASRLAGTGELERVVGLYLDGLPRPLLRAHWPLPDTDKAADDGHTGPIGDCAVSPRGDLLATASDDRLVILWDPVTLQVRRVLRGHSQRVRACVFSPDGSRLLSAATDGTVRIWRVDDGCALHVLGEHSARMLGCAWSADGRWVASAAGDGTVTIWDADTGERHQEMRSPSGNEWDCAFSPDGHGLVSVGEDGVLRMWDIAHGTLRWSTTVHEGRIRCCTFSPSGALMATSGSDATVRVLRADTGQVVHTLRGHTDRVRACAFSPDGTMLASASEDRSIRLWDTAGGRQIRLLRGHTDWVGASVFTADGRTLVSCGGDATLRTWDMTADVPPRTVRATRRAVGCCAFSPDGSGVVAGHSDGAVQLFDVATGRVRFEAEGHDGRVLDCAVSPDGDVVTVGGDGEPVLWDARTGAVRRRFKPHSGRVWGCAVSPDGARMASAGEDGVVRIHDLRTGDVLTELVNHEGHALGCAFSPDGARLASVGDDGSLRLWDSRTGRLESTLSTGRETSLWSCRFSPDGALLASVGSPAAALALWSTADGTVATSVPIGGDRITGCAFSPSGRQIATCGDEGYLGVWDVATGAPVTGIRVAFPLHRCAWSGTDTGSMIAAAGNGGLYLFAYEDD
ncbi:NB-ARC domain-containing protein [Streptomyces sp. NPDC047860]|uniref:WD40 domain-containing protein n=1 Tax=Streptomyces sp. NPDC047860 TaxID=3155743 RepID=UPI003405B0A6